VAPAAKEGVCAALPVLGVPFSLTVGKLLVGDTEREVEEDTPCVAVPPLGGECVARGGDREGEAVLLPPSPTPEWED
jgi:hypothetical protein